MANKGQVIQLWENILNRIGNPPIRLVFNDEWKQITGHDLGNAHGRASRRHHLVGVRYRGRTLAQIEETLWHEAGHLLFPSRPHWWIECYGEKMAGTGNGQGRYSARYGHTADELPPREKLVKLSRRRAAKLKNSS
jgi:hypothetical protein